MYSTHCDEVSLEPSVVLHSGIHGGLCTVLPLHIGVSHIGELCGGVVAPNDDVVHLLRCDPEAGGHLGLGPVLVQACHAGEVVGWQGGGRLQTQHGVGVGRVAHHQHLEGEGWGDSLGPKPIGEWVWPVQLLAVKARTDFTCFIL